MTADQIDLSPESLIKIAKKVKLEESLKKLQYQSEKLKIRAEIEGIDTSDDLAKIDQEVTALKKDSVEYEEYEHPIFDLMEKHSALQDRLKKLNEKKGRIQEVVYDSLKNEYLSQREALTKQLEDTISRLKKIRQEATNGTHSLKYGVEELSVRKDIEEIPDDVYNERITALKSQLTQSEELMTAIGFLLELAEK
jgi:hypothetical protein